MIYVVNRRADKRDPQFPFRIHAISDVMVVMPHTHFSIHFFCPGCCCWCHSDKENRFPRARAFRTNSNCGNRIIPLWAPSDGCDCDWLHRKCTYILDFHTHSRRHIPPECGFPLYFISIPFLFFASRSRMEFFKRNVGRRMSAGFVLIPLSAHVRICSRMYARCAALQLTRPMQYVRRYIAIRCAYFISRQHNHSINRFGVDDISTVCRSHVGTTTSATSAGYPPKFSHDWMNGDGTCVIKFDAQQSYSRKSKWCKIVMSRVLFQFIVYVK